MATCRTGYFGSTRTNDMIEALQFEFMRNALLAGLLACVACGIIGTLVVVNRMVFLAGGIAHAAYGGIGAALYFGWPVAAGTLGFSVLASIVMGALSLRHKHRVDTIIGLTWAVGFAVGVLFVDRTPGYNVDLMGFLFGSILTVPTSDLWIMVTLDLVILGTVTAFYRGFVALSYDDEFAMVRGVPVKMLYFLLLGLIALSVVVIIRVVGLILVIALLTIPPYFGERHARSLRTMMVASFLFSATAVFLGLWVAYVFNLTCGATVILVAAALFGIAQMWEIPKRQRSSTT
jgi:zinc transport system permease protein